jgi:hypothetical protein
VVQRSQRKFAETKKAAEPQTKDLKPATSLNITTETPESAAYYRVYLSVPNEAGRINKEKLGMENWNE